MKHNYSNSFAFMNFLLVFILVFIGFNSVNAQFNFGESNLDLDGLTSLSEGITSLEFGPDDKLYVAEYSGTIKVLTVQKIGANNYKVSNVETLFGVKNIKNHDDDGTVNNTVTDRETTGMVVTGTDQNPVIYVSSSDFRIGGVEHDGDKNLDTNSGIITRFTKDGGSWSAVDMVRGLPRSEENHATNGLQFTTIGGVDYLIVAQGGNTNGGSPSHNFAYANEFALSGAILAIDITALESMPILTEINGRNYIFDLPTVDDPTRDNVNGITDPDDPNYNGIDINDPFGGNDGLNQAMLLSDSPVKIFSPGYRNAYDLFLTANGALYVTDNGANTGWGGFPINEGTANVTNEYDPNETGGDAGEPAPDGEYINNLDHLTLVTTDIQSYSFGSFYGGHPNPIRANPDGAGLYTHDGTTGVFRTKTYDPDGSTPNSTSNVAEALPANWPPVKVAANAIEGDWRGPGLANPEGPEDELVTTWKKNTNSITQYTASNFEGGMQGNLLAGKSGGVVHRVSLKADGTLDELDETFLSGYEDYVLGITAQGDNEVFPGSIWLGTFNGLLKILEPADAVNCIDPSDPLYDPLADYDSDGYTNEDEEDNGTDPCNGGSQPSDFDKLAGAPFISDLNDPDDDNDGIADSEDPFQLGDPSTTGSDAFELPIQNDLYNYQQGLGGIFGLGMTGLMNNGDTGNNWLDWVDQQQESDPGEPNPDDVLGGNPGVMTSHMRYGTAKGVANNQEKAYQMGVQVDQTTGKFTVATHMVNFDGGYQLYGNTGAVGGELGLFLGTGFQDNFVQFVITQDGLAAIQEVNDVLDTVNALSVALTEAERPEVDLYLYIVVDPVTGVLQFDYKIEDGARLTLGTLTANGATLDAIQNAGTDLAVGFIGTSNNAGVELEGSWDWISVKTNVPSIEMDIPDLERYIGSEDEDLDLDTFFDDDMGTANLVYTIENNTNPSEIGAVISGDILTISFSESLQEADITVRATDQDTNYVEQTFKVTVTDSPIVLFRVNAGGPEISNIDGGIDWSADTQAANSSYLVTAGSNSTGSFGVTTFTSEVDQTTTPANIFDTERYDTSSGGTDITYSFPVTATGNYEVRLYMANGYDGTSAAGERIFDVSIEGIYYQKLKNIDLSGTYGHKTGTVISHIVNVTDGSIDISLKHVGPENPLINGIEILEASDLESPIYLGEIADQVNYVGDELNGALVVTAHGGDGNLNFSISGQPDGVTIEPTNGNIIGDIDNAAFTGSPFDVTVTVDDSDGLTNDAMTINFQWVIQERSTYRINAGDIAVEATDNGPSWEYNGASGAYQGVSYSVNTGLNYTTTLLNKNRHPSVPAYIDAPTFGALFSKERYDVAAAPEMVYGIPVENGDYVVQLYLGNSFAEASEPGDRVFDILLEGNVVEDDFDVITEFGHNVAGMLSYPVTVVDEELNISFGHVIENPIISAIEIYRDNQLYPSLSLTDFAGQENAPEETVSFTATATGGDSNVDYEYYISGQPEGIIINMDTGEVSGTIATNAAIGGPNDNGIHQVTVTVKREGSVPYSTSFTWFVTSTWISKNENENYTARHENSFAQAGDKFFLMGGRENPTTVDIYDYSSDTWENLANSMPGSLEFNHFQATEYQGLIWVIGAFNTNDYPNEVPEDHIWAFDPAVREWIQGPEIPEGRRRGSSGLVVYNDKFYVVGGNTIGHNGGYVNWFDEYDPQTGTWTSLTGAPHARDHFAAVLIGDKLYAAGGRLSGGDEGVFAPTIPEVDVYDFTNSSWSTLPVGQNIPTQRAGASAVNFNDKLLVIGGEPEVAGPALTVTEEYDPILQTWNELPSLNFPRHGTQAIVSGNGIFILGGSPSRGGGNQKNMEFLGEDSPVGSPSVASVVNSFGNLLIADGATESIDLIIENGNVGVMITSMELSGPNAADFNIVSGQLANQLLKTNTTHAIEIMLTGTGADRSALLTINYGNNSSKEINLSNALVAPDVTYPGTQNSIEGDDVTLQIAATGSCTDVTYGATGLPPDLNIDVNTGLISGTVSAGSGGSGAFQENNGLLIVEAESGNTTGWGTTTLNGATGIIANTNSLSNQSGGSTIPYQITINTPGVYRFNWRSFYSGSSSTDENDNWLRFPNNSNVWFFGFKGTPVSEEALISNLEGPQANIVFPGGTSRQSASTTPEGSSSNGYFKIWRSSGASQVYDWQARTSDNDPHDVYVYFVNAGTYTVEVSERSAGHAIDKMALYKVDGTAYTNAQLTAAPESGTGGSIGGAADNSPYNVEVTVTDDCVPSQSTVLEFVWNIGEAGNQVPVAVLEADITSGDAPLTVSFTGSNSTDDTGVTDYLWNFKDGTLTETTADPVHIFNTPGIYEVELTVSDGVLSNSTTITITVNTPANQAPVVTNPGGQNGVEGDVLSLQVAATDPEDNVLAYSATGLPTGLSIDTSTGLISGTIATGAATNSPYAVEVTVTDDGTPSESATVSFTWNVTDVPVNQAPMVTNPGVQTGVEGDVISLQIAASDPEDDGMTYSAITLPTGLSIDTSTGLISGTIATGAATNSPYAVEVTVTDDGTPSESATVSFTWNVTDVPVNQ
ncbi:malectin domain-containing carbohydrate-binding protein, partial [Arenibacter sp. F26102]|uniref:malectin domain-containing carbohydrate-binding protein n=1 Tax=Arenibacter sp. F26102 TaxID=2926416 RepID=UPI00248AB278